MGRGNGTGLFNFKFRITKKFSDKDGKASIGFSVDALECLINYDWPGNVRELENLIERLSVLKDMLKSTQVLFAAPMHSNCFILICRCSREIGEKDSL